MASTRLQPDLSIPLRGISYDLYVQLRELPENQRLRMTYHNGTLEVMSPLYRHEKYSRRLGLLVLAVTEVLSIPCQGTGSTTFRRRGHRVTKGWGKEPDQGFYIAHEVEIRGKDEIDLETDPPPDLWIEVDNRGSSRGRFPLYAALQVPEVWRYRPKSRRLWFGQLREGSYVEIDRSEALPMLTPPLVLEALEIGDNLAESQLAPKLRDWVRTRLAMP